MLEISRKEAKSLNALLAEILGKMGRSKAKLRDFVRLQVAVRPVSLGEQLLAHWYQTGTMKGCCKQPGPNKLLFGCLY